MKTKTIYCLFFILIFAVACEEVEYTQEAADIPVIESFLVPGQAPMVKITRIIPYAAGEADTVAVPISGIEVILTINGLDHNLLENSAGSGLYTPTDTTILVNPGDSVYFSAVYKGTLLTAGTVVPSAPANLTLSDDVLYYTMGDPSTWLSAGEIELSWANPEEDFYYITVANIETDPVALNEMAEDMPKFASSSPSTGDQFKIGMRNVTYFGTHQVIIYHVNNEFAELFDNPGMSSVGLTEPPTNVTNGLGIFTAMYPDTVYFEVRTK